MTYRQKPQSRFPLLNKVYLCLTIALVTSITTTASNAKEIVNLGIIKHTRHKHEYLAERESYFIDLLDMALRKSQANYQLQAIYVEPHSEYRGAQYLINGKYDVHWLNTTTQLERDLIPIRIPLFKGIIGWRLFLIREADLEKFAQIKTVDDLKQYVALQGYSWPDTQVLRHNGFTVDTATGLFSLLRMLEHKRGDFLPRSITEAWAEIDSFSTMDIAVERHLILHYPEAYYFFVQKKDLALAKAIENGLNLAIEDGSFDQMFWPYFQEAIEKTRLDSRLVLSIPNPVLPAETPLDDARLWFSIPDLPK